MKLLLSMPGTGEMILIILVLIITVFALFDIIRKDFKDTQTKLLWILLVLFLPILGPIIYSRLGRN